MLMKPGATASPVASTTLAAVRAGEIADRRDAVAADADVGPPSRRAGAVVDRAAADDDVEHWRLLRECVTAAQEGESEDQNDESGQ